MRHFTLIILAVIALASCGNDGDSIREQLNQYVTENNISNLDSLPSGLWYAIDEEGDDVKPQGDDIMILTYTAHYSDGEIFDSGQNVTFVLSNLIEGLKEGLQLIGNGGEISLMVPPELAFGTEPPNGVRPNALLIYNIDLIMISLTPDQQIRQYVEENNVVGLDSLDSGLYFVIVEEGDEDRPVNSDFINVGYDGYYIDGVRFDANEGATLDLGGVIEGWRQGIPLIGKGGVIKLIIPPNLAYGPFPTNGIRPGAVLIFDVELFDFF